METKTKVIVIIVLLVTSIISYILLRRTNPKLSWPIEGQRRITSEFGEKRTTGTHSGLDIAAPTGTPILAPAGGVVQSVYYNAVGGNQLIIEHTDSLKTGYAHLSKTDVKKGDKVKRGQKIGEVGNTGRSTGPHLHFTVTFLGIKQNPRDYLV